MEVNRSAETLVLCSENLHSEFKALRAYLGLHARAHAHTLLDTLVRQIFLDFSILALGYCRLSCLFWIHTH